MSTLTVQTSDPGYTFVTTITEHTDTEITGAEITENGITGEEMITAEMMVVETTDEAMDAAVNGEVTKKR